MKLSYKKEEKKKLALWLCSTYGKTNVITNKQIVEAQQHVLPKERHKPLNYGLIPALTKLVEKLDELDLNIFESTRSVIEHGVID